jgi:SWI/SNF-related matrix-associated actin-dependent regulator of chromatin subfamily A member 5
VLAPKSTLNNWMREFEKWLPDSRVVLLQGNKTEREDLIRTRIVPGGFDVVLTSYEILLREKNHLKKFAWR